MNALTSCTAGMILALTISLPAVSHSADAGVPTYTPPLRGAPAARIGGGTRSAGAPRLALEAVAPDHTGLTSAAQPTLYWYASEAVSAPVEFTLLAADAEKPLVERRLGASKGSGIQPIALSSLGVSLKSGTEYQWFVSVVSDPAQRSRDVTAGGSIRRSDGDAGLRSRLAKADERSAAYVYAQAGYFYDAIDAVSKLIARNPTDAGLRAQRAALLEQVGLAKVAAADRGGAAP